MYSNSVNKNVTKCSGLTLSQQLFAKFGKMRQGVLYGFVLSFLALVSAQVIGQTTTIDFETANAGYTPSTTSGSGWTDVFNRSNSTSIGASNQTGYYWAVEDMSPTNPTIDLDQINVTGSSDFTFSIDMLAHHFEDWDATDELGIVYSIDGGSYQNLMWVQMVPNPGNPSDNFNGPAALDLAFDGDGDCGASTTLPSISTGTEHGCTVSSSDFATFSAGPIALSGNSTLDIRLEFYNLTSGDEGIYLDNIVITETAGASCAISDIGLSNVQCDDNGTSGSTADDFITFDLNPTGSNLGTDYTVSVSSSSITSSTTGTYGGTSSFTMAAGSAGGGNVTVTITDDTDGSCTANDLLTDPGSCSVSPCTEPSQPSGLTFTNVTDGQIDGSFTGSGADEYLVVIHTASSLSTNPVDVTTYSAGDPLGGGEVVQSSSATTFSATGLAASTQYYIFVFGYNNTACSGGPNYNITASLSDDTTTTAAPVSFATQSFEGSGWTFTEDPLTYQVGSDIWAEIASPQNGLTATDGSNFWFMQDLDNPNGGRSSPNHALTFASQSLSGYTNVTLSFDYEVFEWDTGDDLFYELFEDGVGQGQVKLVDGYSNLSASGSVTLNISPSATSCYIVIEATQNGGGDYGFIDNVTLNGIASALPIELKYFRGHAESVGNLLEWKTLSETNNDYFSLERLSPYGDFQTIAEIDGAGNSNVPLSYFFRDINLIDFGHYYRLKQTDFDGQFSYSDIIFISSRGKGSDKHNFYWDMFNQELVIEASEEYRELVVYDLQGRMIRQYPLASETKHFFALPNLSGLYIAEVRSAFSSDRKKIIINR